MIVIWLWESLSIIVGSPPDVGTLTPFTLSNNDVLTSHHPLGDTDTVDTKQGGKASINCMMYSLLAAPFGSAYPCTYLNEQFCNYRWINPCKAPS